jgi:ABC-2 type transport system ATP-binding protein
MTTANAVDVRRLVKRYGDNTALAGIDLAVPAGTITAVLGPNGAGKTSTVEVLEGYRPASAGRTTVLGLDPVADHTQLAGRMGVMLQQGGIYPGIRAREAAALFCSYYGGRRDPDDLLASVGLTERARSTWRELSGGEQQRLSFGLALAGEPEVVFLDEPTASVDVVGRQRVRALIRTLAERGACVILTTHELEEAERVADRLLIIDRGRLLVSGTPDELTRAVRTAELRFGAPRHLDVAGLGATLGVLVREETPGEYVVEGEPEPALVAELTAWLAERNVPLADLHAGRKRLEDVYVSLTRREETPDVAGSATQPGRRRAGRRRRAR